MLNGPIPSHVDPRKLADRDVVLEGDLKVASMTRLCALLARQDGEFQVRLHFARDESRMPRVAGELDGDVWMVCQRCLEAAQFSVRSDFDYAIVSEDSRDRLPKGEDALEVGEEPLDLLTLIEDELLLALPIVPVHAVEDCAQKADYSTAPETGEEAPERPNPFSVLAQLKRDPN